LRHLPSEVDYLRSRQNDLQRYPYLLLEMHFFRSEKERYQNYEELLRLER
jgi:hypothetical protein